MSSDVKRVMTFWFNRPPLEWIIAPAGLDDQMKSEFGHLVEKARQNELDDWALEPEGSLALVVILDQFSRNLFRGSPEAFSTDTKASSTTAKAIAKDFDKQVTVIQASAFYLSLMQQESLLSLVAARSLFEGLKHRCVSDEEHKWVDLCITACKRHMDQLEQFGRYPSRNALLGRENAAAEEEYLKEHIPKRVEEVQKSLN
ncbi:DUF924-domain-containing protein [Lophiostoma macrostomum CBS 122681]|uniref:DUF924-domain-containing protein n=1 Tax=Lophiostoma macrostomum CBS 122681 TaxID=1314788 RepID=A0A6A6T4Z6_9PLEO|nr:DUF924-domain-containing protein [Lophiostoma macrostomum CBS 122681]